MNRVLRVTRKTSSNGDQIGLKRLGHPLGYLIAFLRARASRSEVHMRPTRLPGRPAERRPVTGVRWSQSGCPEALRESNPAADPLLLVPLVASEDYAAVTSTCLPPVRPASQAAGSEHRPHLGEIVNHATTQRQRQSEPLPPPQSPLDDLFELHPLTRETETVLVRCVLLRGRADERSATSSAVPGMVRPHTSRPEAGAQSAGVTILRLHRRITCKRRALSSSGVDFSATRRRWRRHMRRQWPSLW
jgi:hypothetical protein